MEDNNRNENKAIKILFQKLTSDSYKQKEYRDVFVVNILPKRINNSKYISFENNILKNNSYNIINKYILALSKLYLYDNNIFKLIKSENDTLKFEEYNNDLERFIDDSIYNLSIKGKTLDLIFNDLKIGLEVGNWSIKIVDFGCVELKLVMDIFKSEGLFIRRPFY